MSYILQGQKCGAIAFHETGTVIAESKSLSAKVTENPIEDGSNINDHVHLSAQTMQINGIVSTGMQALADLERMYNEKDLVTYVGKFSFPTSVITSLSITGASTNSKGGNFSLTLQEVKIAVAEKVEVSGQDTMNDTDNAQGSSEKVQSNKGRQTTKTEKVSADSYANGYVKAFNNKPATGTNQRNNRSYSGMTK